MTPARFLDQRVNNLSERKKSRRVCMQRERGNERDTKRERTEACASETRSFLKEKMGGK